MGYHRSAKKCKEKFENVHKYYKRSKEGKTGRQAGKSYRFFAQLEALYGKKTSSPSTTSTALPSGHRLISSATINTIIRPPPPPLSNPTGLSSGLSNAPHCENSGKTSLMALSGHGGQINAASGAAISTAVPLASLPPLIVVPTSSPPSVVVATMNAHIAKTLEKVESMKRIRESDESDNDSEDDEDYDDDGDEDDVEEEIEKPSKIGEDFRIFHRGTKRKKNSMKKYMLVFEKVMKKVLDKQEHMQQQFFEALERRDHDRMIREEAWKRQEMARLNRECDVQAAERALSASRDASLVELLQKIAGQGTTLPQQQTGNGVPSPLQVPNTYQPAPLVPAAQECAAQAEDLSTAYKEVYDPGSKRWPKPEVLTLIKLRTSLDKRFHEPGSKGTLWEEISAAMSAERYHRTAKQCKEKWENINKYYRKAKESTRKRPEDAKTCPYFHHLDALYREGLLGGSTDINNKRYDQVESWEQTQGGQPQTVLLPYGDVAAQPASAVASTTPGSLAVRPSTSSADVHTRIAMGNERGDVKDHAGIAIGIIGTTPSANGIAVSATPPPFNLFDQAAATSIHRAPSGLGLKQGEQKLP
ncbi:hypothetical protein KP509_35G006300 [Ceratopteris richardii]|nr:hypothetical protein KP509_35G006300 [Ceratopteris richardii]